MDTIPYPLQYRRNRTREVKIGQLTIGGDHPICLQSMLTSSTQDVKKCIEEIKSLVEVDCELIRLTVPSRKDLEAMQEIRRIMKEEGLFVPLVADIHFSPKLAVEACEFFEKVRINPGNFSDDPKNTFKKVSQLDFDEGQDILSEAIKPLVKNLQKYRRALRIGVNQGSLSSRMMEKFGDSPVGMVESALEAVRLFEEQGFNQIVVSLKSSNPIVVQKAYRMLVARQPKANQVPLHLGVTEAGNGLIGRIKSLSGIGTLLKDGIGNTIRVSLTEKSANEIVFAREYLSKLKFAPESNDDSEFFWKRPINHQRIRNGLQKYNGTPVGDGLPIKIGKIGGRALPISEVPFEPDFEYQEEKNQYVVKSNDQKFLAFRDIDDLIDGSAIDETAGVLIDPESSFVSLRQFYSKAENRADIPVGMILPLTMDYECQTQLAGALSEGLLDFILFPKEISSEVLQRFLYLLQATRSRILFTDYIICPSCGRTLFDIQSTSEKIKEKTSHLKGLKIGVMGCIVNGPGEMADADFGYVGSGSGKIDLYYQQERVFRGIDEKDAVERLVELIKVKGRWKDPA